MAAGALREKLKRPLLRRSAANPVRTALPPQFREKAPNFQPDLTHPLQ